MAGNEGALLSDNVLSIEEKAEYMYRAGLIHFLCIQRSEPYGPAVIDVEHYLFNKCYHHYYNMNFSSDLSETFDTYLCFSRRDKFDVFTHDERVRICNYFYNKHHD